MAAPHTIQQPHIVNSFPVPIQQVSPEDQGFRRFDVVAETEYLEVPGCLEVLEVRLDRVEIPAHVDHVVPTDSTLKNFATIRMPMYQLTEGPGGTPVLVRSLNCNDGKWQAGSAVFVRGRWADEQGGDGLMAKTVAELRGIAKELGKDFPAVGVRKADIAEFIRSAQSQSGE